MPRARVSLSSSTRRKQARVTDGTSVDEKRTSSSATSSGAAAKAPGTLLAFYDRKRGIAPAPVARRSAAYERLASICPRSVGHPVEPSKPAETLSWLPPSHHPQGLLEVLAGIAPSMDESAAGPFLSGQSIVQRVGADAFGIHGAQLQLVTKWARENAHAMYLLTDQEHRILERIRSLGPRGSVLLARLAARQGRWFRTASFRRYKDLLGRGFQPGASESVPDPVVQTAVGELLDLSLAAALPRERDASSSQLPESLGQALEAVESVFTVEEIKSVLHALGVRNRPQRGQSSAQGSEESGGSEKEGGEEAGGACQWLPSDAPCALEALSSLGVPITANGGRSEATPKQSALALLRRVAQSQRTVFGGYLPVEAAAYRVALESHQKRTAAAAPTATAVPMISLCRSVLSVIAKVSDAFFLTKSSRAVASGLPPAPAEECPSGGVVILQGTRLEECATEAQRGLHNVLNSSQAAVPPGRGSSIPEELVRWSSTAHRAPDPANLSASPLLQHIYGWGRPVLLRDVVATPMFASATEYEWFVLARDFAQQELPRIDQATTKPNDDVAGVDHAVASAIADMEGDLFQSMCLFAALDTRSVGFALTLFSWNAWTRRFDNEGFIHRAAKPGIAAIIRASRGCLRCVLRAIICMKLFQAWREAKPNDIVRIRGLEAGAWWVPTSEFVSPLPQTFVTASSDPPRIDRTRAGSVLASTIWYHVDWLEKAGLRLTASKALCSLLNSSDTPQRRWRWWERLAVNLCHLELCVRCHDVEEEGLDEDTVCTGVCRTRLCCSWSDARIVCRKALRDPTVPFPEQAALRRRCARLNRKLGLSSEESEPMSLARLADASVTADLYDFVSEPVARCVEDDAVLVNRPLNRVTSERSRFVGLDRSNEPPSWTCVEEPVAWVWRHSAQTLRMVPHPDLLHHFPRTADGGVNVTDWVMHCLGFPVDTFVFQEPVGCWVKAADLASYHPATLSDDTTRRAWGRGRGGIATGDRLRVSVEELVLQEMAIRGGWRGMHCEGSLLVDLLLLLSSRVLRQEVPGAFLSPWQDHPLDFHFPRVFYNRRQPEIENLLRELGRATPDELVHWIAQEHTGADAGVVPMLQLLGLSLGGKSLAYILRHVLLDPHYWLGGLPDLLLFRVVADAEAIKGLVEEGTSPRQEKEAERLSHLRGCAFHCRFLEVKGPRDRLMERQSGWLTILAAAGVRVGVFRVKESCRGKRGRTEDDEEDVDEDLL